MQHLPQALCRLGFRGMFSTGHGNQGGHELGLHRGAARPQQRHQTTAFDVVLGDESGEGMIPPGLSMDGINHGGGSRVRSKPPAIALCIWWPHLVPLPCFPCNSRNAEERGPQEAAVDASVRGAANPPSLPPSPHTPRGKLPPYATQPRRRRGIGVVTDLLMRGRKKKTQ